MRPVDKKEFWLDRIERSKKSHIHHSVYGCNLNLWQALERHHIKLIKENIEEGDRILDAACGYGRISKFFETDQYVGVDFSPDFINIAKSIFPNKKFLVADLKSLPFKDKEFNCVIGISIKAMIVRELGMDEWEKMESELRRVSKKIILLEYSDGKENHFKNNIEIINED